ncbi:MAG TPA: septation protein IspZ [Hyphomicrobiaceae bacterium]|jgi:intracellular septation protein|nr:septation protein IspZ [Hyphomicrobiaceae bacterium]
MRVALQQLASDFLSAIIFLVFYLLTGSVTLATGVAIAAGIGQIAFMKATGRPIEAMQWLALALVVVLGSATLITQDSRFIMAKPSLVHWAIGGVMLRHGWMIRYLPPIARDNLPPGVMVAAGYAWAGLMFVLGALNLTIATTMSIQAWAWFITVGAVGAKVAAFLLQYGLFRSIIRRKLSAAPTAPQPQTGTP